MLRQGIVPVLIGIAAGLTTSIALRHYLKVVLYGVSATDPVAYVLAAMAMIFTAALAISIPARRASRLDPMMTLRHQ